jgi:hypothetical protein
LNWPKQYSKTRSLLGESTIEKEYGEQRFILLGMAKGQILLLVAYTERGDRTRIISARKVTKHEQQQYFKENSSTYVH